MKQFAPIRSQRFRSLLIGFLLASGLYGCDALPDNVKKISDRIASLVLENQETPPKQVSPDKTPTRQSPNQGASRSITLTGEESENLGIKTVVLKPGAYFETRTLGGEVIIPPGKTLSVSAPISGVVLAPANSPLPMVGSTFQKNQKMLRLLMLPPDKDVLTARNSLKLAENRTRFAEQKFQRAEQLLNKGAGSLRAKEEAWNELQNSRTDLRQAKVLVDLIANQDISASIEEFAPFEINAPIEGRLQNLLVAPGQRVSAGSPLFQIASEKPLWVRVPVYAGIVNRVRQKDSVRVHSLSNMKSSGGWTAIPVLAPPTGNPQAASVDLYFELPTDQKTFHPGQKVAATLKLKRKKKGWFLPSSAVLYDSRGETWVYENTRGHEFIRRSIEISSTEDDSVVLTRGPGKGKRVVISGAAELFGVEFGNGK